VLESASAKTPERAIAQADKFPSAIQEKISREVGDLTGSVDGLPTDLSLRKKHHLRMTGYGRKRPRGSLVHVRTS
jgi:hypothetical protein